MFRQSAEMRHSEGDSRVAQDRKLDSRQQHFLDGWRQLQRNNIQVLSMSDAGLSQSFNDV
jgi:hypothetical protein